MCERFLQAWTWARDSLKLETLDASMRNSFFADNPNDEIDWDDVTIVEKYEGPTNQPLEWYGYMI